MSQSCHHQPDDEGREQLDLYRKTRMERIGRKLLVLSGKGGVGKSTVAAGLARALSSQGQAVGLLDIDLHGPSICTLLGLAGKKLSADPDGMIEPLEVESGMKVVSIGLLLDSADAAVIWRGPMKYGVIEQFLAQVNWGPLDVLIVDCPPGTGDEPLAVAELIGHGAEAVIVTTPQDVAIADVRRSISFCRQLELPIAGLVENMSGFTCPHCSETINLFGAGSVDQLAASTGLSVLGRIRLDPDVVTAGDAGRAIGAGAAATDLAAIAATLSTRNYKLQTSPLTESKTMKIAIPTADGQLCMHFGHCQTFTILQVDKQAGRIESSESLTPPPHEPGLLPRWLAEQGADVILAGGMGQRAQSLFAAESIEVVVGAPAEAPEDLAKAWLAGTLEAGSNVCDH